MNGALCRNRSHAAEGAERVTTYQPFESISQSVASVVAPLIFSLGERCFAQPR
jgi:hypothetical protein